MGPLVLGELRGGMRFFWEMLSRASQELTRDEGLMDGICHRVCELDGSSGI